MAAPVTVKATPGNLLTATTIAASKNTAIIRDSTALIEDQISVRMTTSGSVLTTAGLKVEFLRVYGSTSTTGAVSAAGTSIPVASATGLAVGMRICIAPDGTNPGEIRTISAISSLTLTIDALQSAHISGAAVYVIAQTPRPALTLGATNANTSYGDTFDMGPGWYCIALTNTDSGNSVTAEISDTTITAFS